MAANLDESHIADLEASLARLDLPAHEVTVLVRHLSDRLASHIGAENVEAWQADSGLHTFGVEEIAMLMVAELAPILESLPEESISESLTSKALISEGAAHASRLSA